MRSNEAGSLGSALMLVTHSKRRWATASFTGRVANCRRPIHQAVAQFVVGRFLAGDADHAEFVRQQFRFGEIVQRRHHQPVGQVAGDAEDDERAGVGFGLLRRAVGSHQ
jgi:hypothetical protein